MRFLTCEILWPVLKQTTLNYGILYRILQYFIKGRLKSTSSKLVSFKVMATALLMPSLGTRSVLTENVDALVLRRTFVSGKYSKAKIYLFTHEVLLVACLTNETSRKLAAKSKLICKNVIILTVIQTEYIIQYLSGTCVDTKRYRQY